jgi:hypothetical protein
MGKRISVVDFLGNAATNNITVRASAIDGGFVTYPITTNHGRVELVYSWTPGGSGGAAWR